MKNRNLSKVRTKKERIKKTNQSKILKVNLKSKIRIAKIKIKRVRRAMRSSNRTNNKMKPQRNKKALNQIVSRIHLVNLAMKNSKISKHWSNGSGELKTTQANY